MFPHLPDCDRIGAQRWFFLTYIARRKANDITTKRLRVNNIHKFQARINGFRKTFKLF
jgi:hypothetical protein